LNLITMNENQFPQITIFFTSLHFIYLFVIKAISFLSKKFISLTNKSLNTGSHSTCVCY
jgi:hypothetical protein